MRHVTILALLVLMNLSYARAQTCNTTTCVLPDCRCCTDKSAPGNLAVADIPQIIMISFEGTINKDNVQYYRPILDLTNPNGCKAGGTFFIQDQGTEYNIVKELYDEGHEIGVHSVDGKPSTNTSGHWSDAFKKVIGTLTDIGVKKSDIHGVRLPELHIDGDDEFNGMESNGLLYDSTCSNVQLSIPGTFIWPCTYDFTNNNLCQNGDVPTKAYPGVWEVMLTDLHDLTPEKIACIVPSACREITTKRDAFDIFFNAFTEHYNGDRTPLNMIIDPAWPQNKDFLDGTIEFLEYVRVAFVDEVWVVPIWKALDWVKQPTKIADLMDFDPWKC